MAATRGHYFSVHAVGVRIRFKGFALAASAHPAACFPVRKGGRGNRVASLTWGLAPYPNPISMPAPQPVGGSTA